jgi:hypothetical protein
VREQSGSFLCLRLSDPRQHSADLKANEKLLASLGFGASNNTGFGASNTSGGIFGNNNQTAGAFGSGG